MDTQTLYEPTSFLGFEQTSHAGGKWLGHGRDTALSFRVGSDIYRNRKLSKPEVVPGCVWVWEGRG